MQFNIKNEFMYESSHSSEWKLIWWLVCVISNKIFAQLNAASSRSMKLKKFHGIKIKIVG